MLLYELKRGFAYRSIRHPEMSWYTTKLPALIAVAVLASYYLLPERPHLLGKDGLLVATLSVLSTLPGFYFAGLAAVATFGNADMDRELPHPAPEITIKVAGQPVIIKLTRRLFLSYLFSYLVVISFLLCLAILALTAATPAIVSLHADLLAQKGGSDIWLGAKLFGVAVLASLAATLTVSTLHGVYFLAEKMHQP